MAVSHSNCLFCQLPSERIVHDASHHWVIRDAYPVTTGHTLIISKRHAETWFDLTDEEHGELNHIFSPTCTMLGVVQLLDRSRA